ncbi:interferon-induced protein 44-like, partial [Sinocyclocheilus rhinocerous]|uniref:interferon-induced protein 44-like n=1 Tax=Sinocyclocheilus rhinocerous TaxID=307959 RepID=UPI0007B8D089
MSLSWDHTRIWCASLYKGRECRPPWWLMQKEMLKKRLEEFSVSHPDVKHIRILLAGPIRSGKSSFINYVNNVFRGRITSGAIVDSNIFSFPKGLTTYRVRGADCDLPFVLTDTTGLQSHILAGSQPEDITQAVFGHMKENYKFNPEEPLSHTSEDYISDPSLSDQAFCLVYTVDATSIHITDDQFIDKLRIIHQSISDI